MFIREPILAQASPLLRLLMLIAIIFVSVLITAVLGILIGIPFFGKEIIAYLSSQSDLSNPESIPLLKYLQIVNQVGVFIIPPVLYAFLVNRNIKSYLRLDKKPFLFSLIAGSVLVLLALPMLHWLAGINEIVRLPQVLSGIEEWFRNVEERAQEITELFINVKTIPAFLVNLLMIAILPAIGEEFLFRGVILRWFNEWIKNIHIAVLLSAFIFSVLHFQFYGFLPRFMLGIILGYLFVWSGSLWVPIAVHFINNAIAVCMIFYINRVGHDIALEEIGSTTNNNYILLSTLITIFLAGTIYFYEKKRRIQKKETSLNEIS